MDTIKSLTLIPQSPEQPPLKVTVQDKERYTPFSLAVLRGHREVARGILDISFAQYEKTEALKSRYRLMEDDDSDCDDSDDVQIYKEIVDDKFTIENIGEVATQVKSDVSPVKLMRQDVVPSHYQRYCEPHRKFTHGIANEEVCASGTMQLMQWAIATDDKDLFDFLAELGLHWTERMKPTGAETDSLPDFGIDLFEYSQGLGRLDIMAEEIRRFGAGMDVQSLISASGVKLVEKTNQYYQGLSVSVTVIHVWIFTLTLSDPREER